MKGLKGISIEQFVGELGSTEPVPGGGTTAALTGALAAALVQKVAALAQKRGREVGESVTRAADFVRKFLELAEADAEAYAQVVAAQKKAGEELESLGSRRRCSLGNRAEGLGPHGLSGTAPHPLPKACS